MLRWLPRAALVVATLLLGLWSRTAQELDATHAHVVCPEHGELIEQVPGKGPAHAEITAKIATVHHEGCLLGWWSHTDPPVRTPHVPVLDAPVAWDLPAARVAESVAYVRPALLDAPKTSPPGS